MAAALGGRTVLFDVVLGRNGSQKGPGLAIRVSA